MQSPIPSGIHMQEFLSRLYLINEFHISNITKQCQIVSQKWFYRNKFSSELYDLTLLHQYLVLLGVLIFAKWLGIKLCLAVVLICVSLVINEVENFFLYLLVHMFHMLKIPYVYWYVLFLSHFVLFFQCIN